MKEYMKYISDDYQEVIQIKENQNGTYNIEKSFLPLIKIDNPDEDENTEYVAIKYILGNDTIQFQMLQAGHGEESYDNIRIIPINEQSIILFDGCNSESHTELKRNINWMLNNIEAINDIINSFPDHCVARKFGFIKEKC